MDADFTKQDLDVLFKAVEKWEQDDPSGELIGMMVEGMLGDRSPEAKAKIQAEREERERKRKIAMRQRKERGVILRAKLVLLKDKADAEAFSDSV